MTIIVQHHNHPHTTIGYRDRAGDFVQVASLATFHHEAAGWADVIERMGEQDGVVVYRPAGYNGCPCNRCVQGWTANENDPRDRDLPGDRQS